MKFTTFLLPFLKRIPINNFPTDVISICLRILNFEVIKLNSETTVLLRQQDLLSRQLHLLNDANFSLMQHLMCMKEVNITSIS